MNKPEVALLGGRSGGFDRRELTLWLRGLVGELAPSARGIAVKLCGDPAMRALNCAPVTYV